MQVHRSIQLILCIALLGAPLMQGAAAKVQPKKKVAAAAGAGAKTKPAVKKPAPKPAPKKKVSSKKAAPKPAAKLTTVQQLEQLFDASKKDDVKTINALIKKNKNLLNMVAPEGTRGVSQGVTPLHVAAAAGRLNAVDALIKLGANLYIKNALGLTPRELALQIQGNTGVVNRIFEAEAMNPQVEPKRKRAEGAPVSLISFDAFMQAAQTGDLNTVREAIAAYPQFLERSDAKGDTALIAASMGRNLDIVNYLIEQMQSRKLENFYIILNAKNNQGDSALKIARALGNKEIAERLMQAGAEEAEEVAGQITADTLFDAIEQRDANQVALIISLNPQLLNEQKNGKTALARAREIGDQAVIDVLTEAAGEITINTLFDAIEAGDRNQVELIINLKPELVNQRKAGKSPLSRAMEKGNAAIVDLLNKALEEPGIEVGGEGRAPAEEKKKEAAKPNLGPLFAAINLGDLKRVGSILDKNPNLVNQKAVADGYTPLMVSTEKNQIDIVRFLLERPNIDLTIKNNRGQTALDVAASIPGRDAQIIANQIRQKLNLPLEAPKPVEEKKKGAAAAAKKPTLTELMLAIGKKETRKVHSILTDAPELLNMRSSQDGSTPLMTAVATKGDNLPVVGTILSFNPDLTIKNNRGQTALDVAASIPGKDAQIVANQIRQKLNLPLEAIESAPAEEKKKEAASPLAQFLKAAAENNVDALKTYPKDLINQQNNNGSTALMFAVAGIGEDPTLWEKAKKENAVTWLIRNGAKIDIQNNKGQTALDIAIEGKKTKLIRWIWFTYAVNGDLAAVKYIFSKLPKLLNNPIPGEAGATALILAADRGHLDLVKFLLEKGAAADIKDAEGKTAGDYALERGHTEISHLLAKAAGAMQPPAIEVPRPQGLPAREEKREGAEVKPKRAAALDDFSDFLQAVRNNQADVINETLSTHPEFLNQKDSLKGYTPLHVAAEVGALSSAHILMRHNANSNIQNVDNKTAEDIARERGHKDIVNLLSDARKKTEEARVAEANEFEYLYNSVLPYLTDAERAEIEASTDDAVTMRMINTRKSEREAHPDLSDAEFKQEKEDLELVRATIPKYAHETILGWINRKPADKDAALDISRQVKDELNLIKQFLPESQFNKYTPAEWYKIDANLRELALEDVEEARKKQAPEPEALFQAGAGEGKRGAARPAISVEEEAGFETTLEPESPRRGYESEPESPRGGYESEEEGTQMFGGAGAMAQAAPAAAKPRPGLSTEELQDFESAQNNLLFEWHGITAEVTIASENAVRQLETVQKRQADLTRLPPAATNRIANEIKNSNDALEAMKTLKQQIDTLAAQLQKIAATSITPATAQEAKVHLAELEERVALAKKIKQHLDKVLQAITKETDAANSAIDKARSELADFSGERQDVLKAQLETQQKKVAGFDQTLKQQLAAQAALNSLTEDQKNTIGQAKIDEWSQRIPKPEEIATFNRQVDDFKAGLAIVQLNLDEVAASVSYTAAFASLGSAADELGKIEKEAASLEKTSQSIFDRSFAVNEEIKAAIA